MLTIWLSVCVFCVLTTFICFVLCFEFFSLSNLLFFIFYRTCFTLLALLLLALKIVKDAEGRFTLFLLSSLVLVFWEFTFSIFSHCLSYHYHHFSMMVIRTVFERVFSLFYWY